MKHQSLRIYLMGFMGSGKSTIGKALSDHLRCSYTDLDQNIEEKNQMSISDIFEKYGEDYFRSLENNELRKLPTKRLEVISLGGGTPMFHDNLHYIQSTGVSFYISVSPNELYERLNHNSNERPLLQGLADKETFLLWIREKLQSREEIYKQANFILDTTGKNVATTVESILDLLSS